MVIASRDQPCWVLLFSDYEGRKGSLLYCLVLHGGFLSRPAPGFLFLLPEFSFVLQLYRSGYNES